MYKFSFTALFVCAACLGIHAQVCNPTFSPTGLTSIYTPGSGALLEWNAVPGSEGVQLKVDLPGGSSIVKRIGAFELDQFFVPDALLVPGIYTWRVQATCTAIPPYDPTPISISNSFTVGAGSTCPATVTDIDGNVYTTVEINGQCWMQENLKVEHYNNGDAIPTGLSDAAWADTYIGETGAFAVYNNVASNKAIYGLLYNWYALDDDRGLCPAGWAAGRDSEWTDLRNFLGGRELAGGKLKATGSVGAGTGYWQSPNNAATNSTGFTALPGGYRDNDGSYEYKGYRAFLWSSGQFGESYGWYRELFYNSGFLDRDYLQKEYGLSVRCVKD